MTIPIILVGGGGHCVSVIDVIETGNVFKIEGIVDVPERLHQKVGGYEIIGTDEDTPRLIKEYRNFMITIGHVKTPDVRVRIYNHFKAQGARFPIVISPMAHVSKNASIAEGSIIMHRAIVNAGASVGKMCIINTGAVIEHESSVGDFTHISTGSYINGQCSIGSKCFFGSCSVMRNNTSICDNVLIGTGSVVVKNITNQGIYFGNPARELNHAG